MAIKSGLAGQLGFATESTYGTAVTVTRFPEFKSESLVQSIERIQSDAIRSGQTIRRSDDWVAGTSSVQGDIVLDLSTKNFAYLLGLTLGTTAAPSGAGPYTHVITPGDVTSSATIQVGKPDVSGTVQPFTFAGCMINTFNLSCGVNEIAEVTLGILGKSVTTATALASASYSSANELLSFTHGSVSFGGSSFKVKSADLTIDNGLAEDRFFLGQATRDQPLLDGYREITGSLTAEFNDLTAYNRFVNGTEAALVLAFTRGSYSVTFTMNVRSDDNTPTVGGTGIVEQEIPFVALATGADSTAITATVVSAEATP